MEIKSSGFVFTNYNNTYYTRKAVESINKFSNISECTIVIVDNNSNIAELKLLDALKKEYPNIWIIKNKENMGYFPGLNKGIEFLMSTKKKYSYILIGNNDLIFPDNFNKSMASISMLLSKYPVICPDLITLDGVHQNPHVIGSISPVREFIWDIFYSNYSLSRIILTIANIIGKMSKRKDSLHFSNAMTIAQGYGACYILSPLFLEIFHYLWAPSFLMGEEFFLQMQLNSRGHSFYYCPQIVVYHQDHASCNKLSNIALWEYSCHSHNIYRKFVKFPFYKVPGSLKIIETLREIGYSL